MELLLKSFQVPVADDRAAQAPWALFKLYIGLYRFYLTVLHCLGALHKLWKQTSHHLSLGS